MTPAATPDLGDRPIRVGPAYRRRAGASNKGRPLTNRWARVQLLVPRCPPNVWPRQTLTPRAPRPAGSTTHHHSTPLTPGERGAALPSVAATRPSYAYAGLANTAVARSTASLVMPWISLSDSWTKVNVITASCTPVTTMVIKRPFNAPLE